MDKDTVHYDVWLIFKQGEGYWLQTFLKRGFGHVLLLTRDDYNWMFLDPHQLRLTYGIAPFKTSDDLPRMLKDEGYTVLHITFFDRDTKNKMRHSRMHNCVSFIKYAMGVKIWALTPYSLYKKLMTLSEKQKDKNGIVAVRQVI